MARERQLCMVRERQLCMARDERTERYNPELYEWALWAGLTTDTCGAGRGGEGAGVSPELHLQQSKAGCPYPKERKRWT